MGIMTVLNSVREIFMLPLNGIANGGQPVISFNYGAKKKRSGESGNSLYYIDRLRVYHDCLGHDRYFPKFWFSIFSNDLQMTDLGIEALKIYFFGLFLWRFSFQVNTLFKRWEMQNMRFSSSLLRKAIIVVPLTLLLPMLGFGVNGVFLAEPISNVIVVWPVISQ